MDKVRILASQISGIETSLIDVKIMPEYRLDANGEPFYARQRLLFVVGCRHRNLQGTNGKQALIDAYQFFLNELESISNKERIYSWSYHDQNSSFFYSGFALKGKNIFYFKYKLGT
ncbi:MAG: hypothetical protein HRT88_01320 [Lentisphaeraceae bacterium]|nr:hypothetical protein [Lentisphaeraceae bacterium]